jgi:copper resistance protein D
MIALVVCRFAHFMAAMLTFGASAYLWLYAAKRIARALSPPVRRLALASSVVALVTAILWLALESASMADDWSAAFDPGAIGAVLTDTVFGHAWAAHLFLAAEAEPGWRSDERFRSTMSCGPVGRTSNAIRL